MCHPNNSVSLLSSTQLSEESLTTDSASLTIDSAS